MPLKRKTTSYLNILKKNVRESKDYLVNCGDILESDVFNLANTTMSDPTEYRTTIKDVECSIAELEISLNQHKQNCKLYWDFF